MSLTPFLANSAWAAASLPAWVRFQRALVDPAAAQHVILRRLIARSATTAFGRAHRFNTISEHATFVDRVPLTDYEALAPWIERIRRGELNVLTSDPVTRLVPTSGSTGARKLIPFTVGLQREFNEAIGPWMIDLFRQEPALLGGSAYWSITPAVGGVAEDSVVPVGFDDDTAYLGGVRRWLVDTIMAVPSSVARIGEVRSFRRATLVALLRRADLRLISVWHPSFLALLFDELVASWDELIRDAGDRRLRRADPREPRTIWPGLRLVSCWADGHAAFGAQDLAQRLPGVRVQAKGLLATEAFVTLPFRQKHPLAITSHFFEFLGEDGRVLLADGLREGETYEVVVSSSGGLWRYRLGDRVAVDGFVERTPSLRFVGRVGGVSDRRGEKLSEAFVGAVLREWWAARAAPHFVLLAPEEDDAGCHCVVYLENDGEVPDVADLDVALRANPHYAWCRDLGQLGPLELFRVESGGYETFVRRAMERGQRLGDIKPVALSAESGWCRRFRGELMTHAGTSRRNRSTRIHLC